MNNHFIEVYYRDKGSIEWKIARGIFYSREHRIQDRLLSDLARIYTHLEFDSNTFLFKGKLEDPGKYVLDDLFRHPEIMKEYSFFERSNFGIKDWDDAFIKIVVPEPLK
jgi:hypothetical protein